jgi:hypothetical protein
VLDSYDGSEDVNIVNMRDVRAERHQFSGRKNFVSSSLPPLESDKYTEEKRNTTGNPGDKQLPEIRNPNHRSKTLHNMIYMKLKAKTDKRKSKANFSVPTSLDDAEEEEDDE